jgi:hypothetical protein
LKNIGSADGDRGVMRDPDAADGAAGPGELDRRPHRLFGADALQHAVDADAAGELLDAGDRWGYHVDNPSRPPIGDADVMIRHLLADLRWYRRVFLPSLRLIWRRRPRQGLDLHSAPAPPPARRVVRGDGGELTDLAAVAPE